MDQDIRDWWRENLLGNSIAMAFTIFFATSTGKTEDVADRLKELLPGVEAKDVDNIGSAEVHPERPVA